MREKEIDLLDLVIEILLRWRTIIAVMLAGGILFAGVSYANSYRVATTQKEKLETQKAEMSEAADSAEADKNWLEEQLTETQINNVINAWCYQQIYEDKIAYQEQSLIMNVDSLNIPVVDITLLVESDNFEKTYNIQKVYEDMVASSALYNYVQEQCMPEYNPNELIALEQTSYNLQEGSDIVRLYVKYDDEKKCQEIANTVVGYILMQQEQLKDVLGEHSVSVIAQSCTNIMNGDYLTLQTNYETEMMGYRNTIVSLQTQFSDDEWRYFNYLSTGKATGNPNDESEEEMDGVGLNGDMEETIPEPSISLKYIILGMLLFACVYVFYVFVKYILNNKLRLTENLADIYNLPQLGMISASEQKKKLFGFIDAWILSLRDRNKRKFSAEEATNMAAVAVKMATKKISSGDVYLVGCDIENQTADVCEKIKSILGKDGIEVKVLDNVLYNAESMAGLENAHCVVLVEKANSTLYDEVEKELELLARQDITVLGGIVVE